MLIDTSTCTVRLPYTARLLTPYEQSGECEINLCFWNPISNISVIAQSTEIFHLRFPLRLFIDSRRLDRAAQLTSTTVLFRDGHYLIERQRYDGKSITVKLAIPEPHVLDFVQAIADIES